MTRINVVPVEELCDEHLRAEFREIVRIPTTIKRRKYSLENMPEEYTVRTEENPAGGIGHVKFFYNKMFFLQKRFHALACELQKRQFKNDLHWVDFEFQKELCKDYEPTEEALALNRKRLKERMPKIPHYNRKRMQ